MKNLKRITAIVVLVCMLTLMLTGCTSSSDGKTMATITVEGYGKIIIELYPDKAPKTVENFVTHSKNGYYDGLTFHRVMFDFMIQGGDPNGDGTGGESIWGGVFEDEFSDLRNFTGALSMAKPNAPDSNGSQFFIVNSKTSLSKEAVNGLRKQQQKPPIDYSDADYKKYEEVGGTPWLDDAHTVFGYVTKGMDVVDKIMKTEIDPQNARPTTPVVIKSIKIK